MRRGSDNCSLLFAAFGAGLAVSLFFSVKLALFLAAIMLICLGLNCR